MPENERHDDGENALRQDARGFRRHKARARKARRGENRKRQGNPQTELELYELRGIKADHKDDKQRKPRKQRNKIMPLAIVGVAEGTEDAGDDIGYDRPAQHAMVWS